MNKLKICTILGARPQFIKAAILSRLNKENSILEIIIHTGQHYDYNMSGLFFNELNLPRPKYNLNIQAKTHGIQTGKMIIGIEKILLKEKPNLVLVYGDTNSTLAGAIAASKLNIPIAHIEAGLRSHNKEMPEEINRILTDHTSSFLFVPHISCTEQLKKEGVKQKNIFLVGDIMYDAVKYYYSLAKNTNILQKLKVEPKSYVLCTLHRAENTKCKIRLKNIIIALQELSLITKIIIPLHPRTHEVLKKYNLLSHLKNVALIIDPLSYFNMLNLIRHSNCIITDSGGLQKEAYFLGVGCITLRDETEWIELILAGWNVLKTPKVPFSLVEEYYTLLSVSKKNNNKNLYGNGKAGSKIIKIIKSFYLKSFPTIAHS